MQNMSSCMFALLNFDMPNHVLCKICKILFKICKICKIYKKCKICQKRSHMFALLSLDMLDHVLTVWSKVRPFGDTNVTDERISRRQN